MVFNGFQIVKVLKRKYSNPVINSFKELPRTYSLRQSQNDAGNLQKCYGSMPSDTVFSSPGNIRKLYKNSSKEELAATRKNVLVTSGRILTFREMSSKLIFLDLHHDGDQIQVILNEAHCNEFQLVKNTLQRGDIVAVEGEVTRTNSKELSVRAHKLNILTPCLRNIPDIKAPEMTEDHRSRWRHLDLISRKEAIEIFKVRSNLTSSIRSFLADHNFTEVETPILSLNSGGASARPFSTVMESMDLPLYLRIAPELYLKRLIIGGFDKVFELGKVFRNEGVDSTHNPEFTSVELYQSFTTTQNMMALMEELLQSLIIKKNNSPVLEYQGVNLKFEGPFEKIDIVPSLENILGQSIPLDDDGECRSFLLSIVREWNIRADPSNHSLSYLFDKVIGHFLEPHCQQPTFLVNHPICMSPLAKRLFSRPALSDRFELFVAGNELMNGYLELNDPYEQRLRFQSQLIERNEGNEEAQLPDEDFVEALEVGMPPTVGCGIGIDRLVMLITDKKHIRDVLTFPLVKPNTK